MRRARTIGVLLGAAVILTACGAQGEDETGTAASSAGGLDGASCSKVHETLEEPRRILAETFGGGREGREARRILVDTIEARPDCFEERDLETARGLRDLLPASDEERHAIEEAEDACGEGVGENVSGTPEQAPHDTVDDVLSDSAESLPPGEPEVVVEAETWVAIDFRDDDDFAGRGMVEQHEDGWFLRRVIRCSDGEFDVVE